MPKISEIQAISKKVNGKKLTTKQAMFIREYAKEPNASKVGRKVYDSKQMGVENLSNPIIQNVFLELMDNEGLTDEYLLGKVKEGIEKGKDDFQYTKLAFELKGRLQKVNVNLSHTIKETKSQYGL